MPTPEMMSLPAGLDPNKFRMNPDGTVQYVSGPNQTKIPLSYFTGPQYQQDMQRYGRIAGPGFIFDEGSPTWDGGAFKMPNLAQGFDPALYTQDQQGQPVGWSQYEGSRIDGINAAYQSLLQNKQSTSDFSKFGTHPDKLGSDVMMALANGGIWIAPGQDMSGRVLQATRNQNGTIQVNDPRGGDGSNPLYNYSADGTYLGQDVGGKAMSYAQGIGSVVGAALGFGALGAAAGGAGAAAGAGAGGGAGAVGSGAGFVGEGALSGIGAWDSALTGAQAGGLGAGVGGSGAFLGEGASSGIPAWDGALSGAQAGGAGSGAFLGENMASGVPEWDAAATNAGLNLQFPSPALPSAGGGSGLTNPFTGKPMDLTSLLGPATSLLGGALGSQGNNASTSADRQLPTFLQQPVGGDLVPRAQGLLAQQMPQAQAAGERMTSGGYAMMNAPMTGNGYTSGAVKLNAPTTATNPYLQSAMDSLGRANGDLLGRGLQGIRGQSAGVGGLGGSRQGVAEAGAIDGATKNLMDAGTNLYYNAYNQDSNRSLQQYQSDQGFFQGQRGQDLTQVGMGAGLLGQGLQTPWIPIQGATAAYSPFSGFGQQTTSQSSGGGAQGFLGGALGAAQFAKNIGLFGNSGSSSGSSWF